MTDFIKHEFYEDGDKIYVKEGEKVFLLEFENALNTYRGFLTTDNVNDSLKGKFSTKIPKALVGFDDISVGSDPVYLGMSTKSIQLGKPVMEKKTKTLMKPPPSKNKKTKLVAIEEEEEEDEEVSTDEEDDDDEDYSCGGSPKKKKVHIISSDDEDDDGDSNKGETRPELKRSKTVSVVVPNASVSTEKIDLDEGDTIPYIGSPLKLTRETSDSYYHISPKDKDNHHDDNDDGGESENFPPPPAAAAEE